MGDSGPVFVRALRSSGDGVPFSRISVGLAAGTVESITTHGPAGPRLIGWRESIAPLAKVSGDKVLAVAASGGTSVSRPRRRTHRTDHRKHQVRQPVQTVDAQDLDSLLPLGVGDYSFVLASRRSSPPSPPASPPVTPSPASTSSLLPPKPNRVSLGKGKFSEVLLVRKGTVEVGPLFFSSLRT